MILTSATMLGGIWPQSEQRNKMHVNSANVGCEVFSTFGLIGGGGGHFNARCKRGPFVFQVHFSYGGADGTMRMLIFTFA